MPAESATEQPGTYTIHRLRDPIPGKEPVTHCLIALRDLPMPPEHQATAIPEQVNCVHCQPLPRRGPRPAC